MLSSGGSMLGRKTGRKCSSSVNSRKDFGRRKEACSRSRPCKREEKGTQVAGAERRDQANSTIGDPF